MKLSLRIHGGLAAGIRLGAPARVLDGASLSPAEAAELARLVAAARAAAPPADTGRARDAMSYTITIEDEAGSESTSLGQSDANMTNAFAALLDWLQERL